MLNVHNLSQSVSFLCSPPCDITDSSPSACNHIKKNITSPLSFLCSLSVSSVLIDLLRISNYFVLGSSLSYISWLRSCSITRSTTKSTIKSLGMCTIFDSLSSCPHELVQVSHLKMNETSGLVQQAVFPPWMVSKALLVP